MVELIRGFREVGEGLGKLVGIAFSAGLVRVGYMGHTDFRDC